MTDDRSPFARCRRRGLIPRVEKQFRKTTSPFQDVLDDFVGGRRSQERRIAPDQVTPHARCHGGIVEQHARNPRSGAKSKQTLTWLGDLDPHQETRPLIRLDSGQLMLTV
jgi:hypothetical protein